MANYVVSDTNLTLIADAIRAKSGHNELLEWPNEYKTSIENLNPVDMCIKTVTDDIVSVSDAAQYDAKNVSIKIEPVQDLHGYANPWPAGGGVNKIDVNQLVSYGTTYGLTISFDGDWIVLSGEYIHTNQAANFRIATQRDNSVFPVTKFKAFPDSNTSSHMPSNPFGLADGNKTLTIRISGMVQGETYNLRCKIVGYEGDTAPTDWTPYSNICPISGWTGANVTRTGKNLFDYRSFPTQTKYGITITNNNDGTFTLDGESVAMVYFDLFNTQFSQSPLPYGTYTLSGMPEGAARNTFAMYVRPAYLFDTGNGVTFTNSVIGGSIIIYSGQVLDNVVIRPQLELGSTATDYEPYQGDTYDIAFPSEAGTVYGGTLDVVNGVLTVDRVGIVVSSATGELRNNGQSSITTRAIFIPSITKLPGLSGFISDRFAIVTQSDVVGKMTGRVASGAVEFHLPVTVPNTTAGVQNWFAENATQLVYELATPVTYTLTPQQIALLRGNNAMWADTGDATLKYFTTAFEDLAEEIGFAEGGDY